MTRLKKENYRVKVRGEGDWVKKREKLHPFRIFHCIPCQESLHIILGSLVHLHSQTYNFNMIRTAI